MILMLLAMLVLLPPTQTDPKTDTDSTVHRCAAIPMNHVQFIGTHNSYKQHLTPALYALIEQVNAGAAANIAYGHPPLTYQLQALGIRKFELDIFYDPDGGRFAQPQGAQLTGDTDYLDHPEMLLPGFKVLHAADFDYRSSCLTLVGCLREIQTWSAQHPAHMPIMIMLEFKESPAGSAVGSTERPLPTYSNAITLQVEQEILQVFSRSQIVTPDLIRGDFETLDQAVTENGWPMLDSVRGKVLFALDNTSYVREAYLENAPVLQERLLFVSAEPGHPAAAFIKMNNSLSDEDLIRARVQSGYLIRTRSDIPMQEAVSGDQTRKTAAFVSGAQYVSTDFPEPAASGFVVSFPQPHVRWRCNPAIIDSPCRATCLTE